MRVRRTTIKIISYLMLMMLASYPIMADDEHPATCVGFIGTMEAAVRSQDPTGPQAYINLADRMYEGINKSITEHSMEPLPLPADEMSEARRSMMVVAECKRNMSLRYSEATTFAYIKMRQALGLAVELSKR